MHRISAVALSALFFLGAPHAHAVDSVSAEIGHGGHDVNMGRVGAQWNWQNGRGYWDAAAGAWTSDRATVYDIGVTPVFRWGGATYVEGGIGAHLLSTGAIEEGRDFSTRFQFGDHIGVGWRRAPYDVSLRLQHLSNAGIDHPNPGINFLQIRLRYDLR